MVSISLHIEGENDLTWARWKRLVSSVEMLGFAGMFCSDHFTRMQPPDKASLDTFVSLAYLADHTKRIHFGPLVSPISFRHPTLLAHQAVTLDDLSGGRLILGLGAGWQEREHAMFGHELGDVPTRISRLEEGLEVITKLLHSNEPVIYEGKFFQLQNAILLPHPRRKGSPPILLGGNGKTRILPLAAKYADIWNGLFLSPEAFHERSILLDKLLQDSGRKPGEVKRTMTTGLYFGKDSADLDQRLSWRHTEPKLAGISLNEMIETLRTENWLNPLVGTPDMLIKQINAYANAGVEELMLVWDDMDNIEGLTEFAETVLSQL